MGIGTKIDFLSQISRKLWGIEYLAHLAQTAILFFAYMREKLLRGAGVEGVGLWRGTFLILVLMICPVEVNTNSRFQPVSFANNEFWSGVQSDPTWYV